MNKDVLVSDVSINTLAVEVKVIKIGSKQVTQSVFKQLPEKELMDEHGKLSGTPWGWVNYHPDCSDKFKSEAEHLHVIYQNGDKLYRSCVVAPHSLYLEVDRVLGETQYEYLKSLVDLSVLDLVRFKIIGGWRPMENITVSYNHSFRVPIGGMSVEVVLHDRSAEKYAIAGMKKDREDAIAELWDMIKGRLGTINTLEINEQSLYLRALGRVEDLNTYMEAYKASYEQLEQLDQLFIAV